MSVSTGMAMGWVWSSLSRVGSLGGGSSWSSGGKEGSSLSAEGETMSSRCSSLGVMVWVCEGKDVWVCVGREKVWREKVVTLNHCNSVKLCIFVTWYTSVCVCVPVVLVPRLLSDHISQ